MEIVTTNSVLNLLYQHRYIFAFLGAFFEGTFIMLLAGVLYKFGYFNFWGLISVLMAGYFLNGVFWYLLGRYGGHKVLEKFAKHSHFARRVLGKLENYFQEHSTKTLFITRITYGLSMFSFMIAGSFKMNFKKFSSITLVASIVWIVGLVGLGYVFGVSYKALGIVTKGIALGVAIVLFTAIVLVSISFVYLLRYFARQKFVQDLENHHVSFVRKIGSLISRMFNNKK